MNPIRLLLVDDHAVVRQGLISLLEGYDDIEVIAEATNGLEALEQAVKVKPDVILMDISMPEMDGVEATERLQHDFPDGRILALTFHEDKQYFFRMLEIGANGYVTKRSLADDVVLAIRAVAQDEAYLPPLFTKWLVDHYRDRILEKRSSQSDMRPFASATEERSTLSEREQQVVALVADGYTSAEIAEKLEIASRTVSRHRERIMEKLDISSTAEMVKFAIRTGLTSA